MPRRRLRTVGLVTGLAIAAVVVGSVWARRGAIQRWYVLRTEFERLDRDSPLAEYRHLRSGLEMVLVPGGRYLRGASEDERGVADHELPRHSVVLSPFLIAKHEVTQEDWRRIVGPRFFLVRGDRLPAHGVSWLEASDFCDAAGLRLPTEAQWECAARGGSNGAWATGDTLEPEAAAFGDLLTGLTEVGSHSPNGFGLHDVHGNVEEWCRDAFDPAEYARYATEVPIDPVATIEADARIVRGGAVLSPDFECRVARRASLPYSAAASSVGLRPVFEFES